MNYLEILDTYRDDMLRTLKDSVAIPSVKDQPVKTADGELLPFGRGVHDSLMHTLGVVAAMGFESHNVDNYAGYIDQKANEEFAAVSRVDAMANPASKRDARVPLFDCLLLGFFASLSDFSSA